MLKRIFERIAVMTKTIAEETAKTSEAALHHVESGRVDKTHSENVAEEQKEVREKHKRVKVNKFAMILAYQGKQYFGMQLQKEHATIEGHLMDAMVKLNWITPEMREKPLKFHFQRAARTDRAVSAVRQICGMQLPNNEDYEATGPAKINELLPSDIRVVGMRRATNLFHPQKMCDARTYSYTLPTFAFAKSNELTNASYRIRLEVIDEINSLLDIYLGTHNFFNYTSRREFQDRSCNRFIMSFECGKPFLYKDTLRNEEVEFITLTVKGQSFVLHQIRKMIGMVIAVVRELQLKSYIQTTFEGERVDVPKAPGLGLLLERVHFGWYDNKHKISHQPLSNWGEEIEAEIERIKFDLITKEILDSEISQQSMMQWLANLVTHDFQCDPESEESAKQSFVTMAVGKAAAALEAKAEEADAVVRSEEADDVVRSEEADDVVKSEEVVEAVQKTEAN